jgi:hypothetical protein
VFDPIAGRIALAEKQANYYKPAFGCVLDAPLGEKFYFLANAVFVL